MNERSFPLAPEQTRRIRAVAEEVLRRSLPTLTEERVIPRSRYRPWIRMAKDYFGHAVSDSDLAQVLESELPQRFPKNMPSIDYPWAYGGPLVEAAVAAATLADEPYEISSPSVQQVIDEFINKMQATPRATVLLVVTDIDVEHAPVPQGYEDRLGESIRIADVRVVRVENKPERFIELELPSAGYDVERDDAVTSPGPAALLVATVDSAVDLDARLATARSRVAQLLAAVRLATGTTARALVMAEGEPDRVHRYGPVITPLRQPWFRYGHRPVTLGTDDVTPIEGLAALLGAFGGGTGQSTPIRLALGRFGRSLDETATSLPDQAVDLAVGLEAALAGRESTEVGLRLRLRAAQLLPTETDSPQQIYADVGGLYSLRSTIVHGAVLTEQSVEKAIRRVTGASRGRGAAEAYALALDRWRDLLRRAILARIALESAAVPWPIAARGRAQLDVDHHLASDEERAEWKRHIRDYWTQRGLPNAVERASDLRLSLGGTTR